MIEPGDASHRDVEEQPEWRLAGIIFFGLVALVLLYAAFKVIQPFLTAILIGAILVILTFNLFRRVRIASKGSSVKAATVMLLGITVLIVIPAVILSTMLVQQANVVVDKLQDGEAQQMLQRIDLTRYLGFIERVAPNFDPATLSPERVLLPALRQ
ncbi:MAG TPA: hypothetical protein VE010_01755, partial [Thermoanaerobaculia bacterium]|nr:hypothetical protein [Thermoanaerobaculia bacterium]